MQFRAVLSLDLRDSRQASQDRFSIVGRDYILLILWSFFEYVCGVNQSVNSKDAVRYILRERGGCFQTAFAKHQSSSTGKQLDTEITVWIFHSSVTLYLSPAVSDHLLNLLERGDNVLKRQAVFFRQSLFENDREHHAIFTCHDARLRCIEIAGHRRAMFPAPPRSDK